MICTNYSAPPHHLVIYLPQLIYTQQIKAEHGKKGREGKSVGGMKRGGSLSGKREKYGIEGKVRNILQSK